MRGKAKMSEKKALYHCRECGHDFDRLPSTPDEELHCPRCESTNLDKSPYLFGTAECSELSPDDYFDTCLAPCCTPNWLGWKNHFLGVSNWDYVLPEKTKTLTDKKGGSEPSPDKT